MSEEYPSFGEKLAALARYVLVAIFAVALVCGTWRAKSETQAFAATPVSAASSYLSFTAKANGGSKFYITDTNKKVICVYSLNSDQLRLVGARKFDQDSKVVDGSIKAPIALEGAGITREQVQQYLKNSQSVLDAEAKKYGHNNFGGE